MPYTYQPPQDCYSNQCFSVPVYVGGNWRDMIFPAPDVWTAYDIACAQFGKHNVKNSVSKV